MARDYKTAGGTTVPAEAIKAAVAAGRAALADGDTDREAFTAAVLAAVDTGAADTGVKVWRVGEVGHNERGDRDCGEDFFDSDGDPEYTCTEDDDHSGMHVASQSYQGLVMAVWRKY